MLAGTVVRPRVGIVRGSRLVGGHVSTADRRTLAARMDRRLQWHLVLLLGLFNHRASRMG